MTKRVAVLVIAAALVSSGAYADFDSLVRAVRAHPGMHRIWTPGFGLARMIVWMIHPEGVSDIQLAIFEGKQKFDRADFERIVSTSNATPMVQVHSNRTGEVAIVWMHPLHGDTFELLVLAHDPKDQTVVVRTVIDGETMARALSHPRHAQDIARTKESD